MITIKEIFNLAKEYGIKVKKETSHSGIFYEEQDGTVCKIRMSDLSFETLNKNSEREENK